MNDVTRLQFMQSFLDRIIKCDNDMKRLELVSTLELLEPPLNVNDCVGILYCFTADSIRMDALQMLHLKFKFKFQDAEHLMETFTDLFEATCYGIFCLLRPRRHRYTQMTEEEKKLCMDDKFIELRDKLMEQSQWSLPEEDVMEMVWKEKEKWDIFRQHREESLIQTKLGAKINQAEAKRRNEEMERQEILRRQEAEAAQRRLEREQEEKKQRQLADDARYARTLAMEADMAGRFIRLHAEPVPGVIGWFNGSSPATATDLYHPPYFTPSSPIHPPKEETKQDFKVTASTKATPAPEGTPDKDICIICSTNLRNTVILDCMHMIMCSNCSPKVDKCPSCRAKFVKGVNVFYT